jgi:hypothetical protein
LRVSPNSAGQDFQARPNPEVRAFSCARRRVDKRRMSPELVTLEMLARGVAIGALAALGAGLWTGGARQPARLAGILFCIGVIAYALNSSPQLRSAIGWALPPVHFVAFGGAGLFWLFIVALFEDRAVSPRTLAPWALLTLVGVAGALAPRPAATAIWVVHNLIEAGFALHALGVMWRSWRGDLVEARRRLRGPFLAAVTFYVLTLSGFEIAEGMGFFRDWFRLLGGASLAIFIALPARSCFCRRGRFCLAPPNPRPRLPTAAIPPTAPCWPSSGR